MSTISLRIEESLKQEFYEVTEKMGIDSSTALRFFINRVVNNPKIIQLNLDEDLLSEVMDSKKKKDSCKKKKKKKNKNKKKDS